MKGENLQNGGTLAGYFDRCADEGIFDEFSPEELPVVRDLLGEMNIRSGQKIVEPGCGAGRLTTFLAESVGPKGRIFAFDISPRMVEKCRARNLPRNAQVALVSAASLPLPDAEFDTVVCLNTFPHLENHPDALREFRRVLRREGTLWIAHTRSRDWVNSLHSSVGGVLSKHLLPTRRKFRSLLRQAGFSLQYLHDLSDRYLLKATPVS